MFFISFAILFVIACVSVFVCYYIVCVYLFPESVFLDSFLCQAPAGSACAMCCVRCVPSAVLCTVCCAVRCAMHCVLCCALCAVRCVRARAIVMSSSVAAWAARTQQL